MKRKTEKLNGSEKLADFLSCEMQLTSCKF